MIHAPAQRTTTTDTSFLGWRAVYNDETCGGHWAEPEQGLRINFLRLRAILYGLMSLLINASNVNLRVKSDNCTAVADITNLVGVK